MKRLLALIENNAQANALARDTTNNILVRIDVIERKLRNGRRANSNSRSPPPGPRAYNSELPSGLSHMVNSQNSDSQRRTESPSIQINSLAKDR